MKRLIKYTPQYTNDGAKFSYCSTEYEVLPVLFPDTAGIEDLKEYIREHKIDATSKKYIADKPKYGNHRTTTITHAIQLKETAIKYDKTVLPMYLGLIVLADGGSLPLMESIDNPISEEQTNDIFNNQEYGVSDFGENISDEPCLVIESWDFFHEMPLLGYPLANFYKALGIEEYTGFSDDTYRCEGCNKFDSRDNGYTYNHRVVNECVLLGVKCGCYDEYLKENWRERVNTNEPIELSVAKELEADGDIKFIERFIGGMTDGRGGYYDGKSCEEGDPTEILEKLLEDNPDGEYIFTHDESGQFQTYFSVWKIVA